MKIDKDKLAIICVHLLKTPSIPFHKDFIEPENDKDSGWMYCCDKHNPNDPEKENISDWKSMCLHCIEKMMITQKPAL